MSQFVPNGPKAYTATADLLQYRVCKYAAGQNVSYAGPSDDVLGVVAANCLNGEQVAIIQRNSEGTVKVTVSGAVSDGDKLWPTGAAGKLINTGVGTAPYTALEAATADGDIIEAKPNVGSGEVGGDTGTGLILYSLLAVTATAATYLIATPKRKVRIVNFWLISRDANASNVKLQNGVTDATANVAKGTNVDAIVAGGTIVAAQANVASGTGISVVSSGNATFDIHVECISTL